MKAKVYLVDFQGQIKQSLAVDVGENLSSVLFRQYLEVLRRRARKGQANVKGRGDVSGGGRKPWRQKGTGRARQGSIRSPLWRGGGVVHGPEPRDFGLRFNQKALKKVWQYVFANKLRQGKNIWLIEKGETPIKTKGAHDFLIKTLPEARRVLLVSGDESLRRGFRNLKVLKSVGAQDLNPLEVNLADALLIDRRDWKKVSERFT